MAFLIFERFMEDGQDLIRDTGEQYKLAGNNLLRAAWERRERPLEQGWHVSASELLSIHSEGKFNDSTHILASDFMPSASHEIGIVSILDVYGFSYCADDPSDPEWSPLMIRYGGLFNHYEPGGLSDSRKAVLLARIPDRGPEVADESVGFLYLKDDWTFGPGGTVNTPFISGAARDYFRRFF